MTVKMFAAPNNVKGVKIQVQNIFDPTREMIASFSEPRTVNVDSFTTGQPLDTNSQPQPPTKHPLMNDPFNTSSRHNIQSSSGDPGISGKPKGLSIQVNGSGLNLKINETDVLQNPNPSSIREVWGAPDSVLEAPLVHPKQRFHSGLGATGTLSQQLLVPTKPTPVMQVSEEDLISDELSKNAGAATIPVDRKRSSSRKAVPRKPLPESTTTAMATRRSTRLRGQLHTEVTPSLAANGVGKKGKHELRRPKTAISRRLGTITSSLTQDPSNTRKILELDNQNVTHSNSTAPVSKIDSSETLRRKEGLYWLSDLLKPLGSGYFYLKQFQSQAALDMFYTVPTAQRETSWVLSHIGRAYFEKAAFEDASKAFSTLRTIDPTNMENMDLYSTTLWHLKREVDLVFLSYELIDLDRLSPEAWCAVGNSFSLQKDHGNAVKCFKRATQLDPKFAYAFSLEGHEHLLNEEYDKAIHAYHSGVAAQRRHYNSWYGLGRVYQKLGKYDMAEKYYRIALKINPGNAVLIGCIGLVCSFLFMVFYKIMP